MARGARYDIMTIKTYNFSNFLELAKIPSRTVFIFHDEKAPVTPFWVEIAGVRNMAGFFRHEDALEYAEFLERKEAE